MCIWRERLSSIESLVCLGETSVYANVDRRPAKYLRKEDRRLEKMKSPVGAAETFPCGPSALASEEQTQN